MIDEAGILVGEPVVILSPDVGRQQVVQRRDRGAPGDLAAHLQPLGMLVEHGVDDVDEGFVAGEQAVPTGEQVTLEPAFTQVLAQHFHHPAIGAQVDIDGLDGRHPCLAANLVDGLQAV